MSRQTCILTTKDLTILEVMLDRCLGRDDPMPPLLRRKIAAARIVLRDDVPADVATLNSRVAFSVDGGEPETRILSHDRMTSPVGAFLAVGSPRGLALLGLQEGEESVMPNQDGADERIRLHRVLYQPEAARREKEAASRAPRPVLTLVRGSLAPGPVPAADGFDDPGPSAA